jgi:hypothetical protein
VVWGIATGGVVRGAAKAFTHLRCGGQNSLESVCKAPNFQISSAEQNVAISLGKNQTNKKTAYFSQFLPISRRVENATSTIVEYVQQ